MLLFLILSMLQSYLFVWFYLFLIGVSSLRLTDEGTSETDRDTLAPLPMPTPWSGGGAASSISAGGGGSTPHIPYYPTGYAPMSYTYSSDPLGSGPMPSSTFVYGREGSVHSGSGMICKPILLICVQNYLFCEMIYEQHRQQRFGRAQRADGW